MVRDPSGPIVQVPPYASLAHPRSPAIVSTVDGSTGCTSGCHAGGWGFDSGWCPFFIFRRSLAENVGPLHCCRVHPLHNTVTRKFRQHKSFRGMYIGWSHRWMGVQLRMRPWCDVMLASPKVTIGTTFENRNRLFWVILRNIIFDLGGKSIQGIYI